MPLAVDLGVTDVLDVVINLFQLEGDVHRDEYKFLCPDHADTSASADVNINTGLWSCFSCGAKGDLAGLGVSVLKKTRDEVVDLLKPGTPDAVLSSVQRKLARAREEAVPAKAASTLLKTNLHLPARYDSGPLHYMRERGFSKRTCVRWGVRYVYEAPIYRDENDDKPFTIYHSIAIPVRGTDGKLVAWCYRKTEKSGDWQPKVLYTPGFDLSGHWFGLHLHQTVSEIFVCEGPLDAMWLDQHGYPALAMMGNNHRNPRKFRMLHGFRKVTVVPDYDQGGVFLAHRLGSLLRGRVPVDVCMWPKAIVRRTGKDEPDPQDVRDGDDLERLVSRSVPWQAWCMRKGLTTKTT